MNSITNSKFKEQFKLIPEYGYYLDYIIPKGLKRFLVEQIVTDDGCSYYESKAPKSGLSNDLTSKTTKEIAYNKIIVDDFVEEVGDKKNEIGVAFAYQLALRLKNEIDKPWIVLLSFDESYCRVSFYENRNEKPFGQIEDDMDAILVLET